MLTILTALLLTATTADAGPWKGNPDRDGDGIHDSIDECPTEAEDYDGYKDEDGCSEPTRVLLVFTDSGGNLLQASAHIEGFGPLPDRRLLHVDLDAGVHQIIIKKDGYLPLVAPLMVPGGEPTRLVLELVPDPALTDAS